MNQSIGPQVEPSLKRKREQLDENDHLGNPIPSIPLAESPAGSVRNKSDAEYSKPATFEQAKDMADHEPKIDRSAAPFLTSRGQAIIDAAQLIAHQAVSGLLRSRTDLSDEIYMAGQNSPDQSTQTTVTQLLRAFFPTNKPCSLKEYASLGEKSPASKSRDQMILNPRISKPPHMAGGLTSMGRSIFKFDSPYTRVRRNGVSTEISPSALSFWEELSLGPAHEPKDIDTFCVCPNSKCIEEGVSAFLSMIKSAYQSCNLGIHDLGASLTIIVSVLSLCLWSQGIRKNSFRTWLLRARGLVPSSQSLGYKMAQPSSTSSTPLKISNTFLGFAMPCRDFPTLTV